MGLTAAAGSALHGPAPSEGEIRKEIMMLRASSLRLAGAAALLVAAMPAAAAAAGESPQKNQAAAAPSDQSPDANAAPTEAAKPKAEERKICRTMDASASRLGAQRVCMTAEQWKHAAY
jgi:hypothetical protein